MQFGNVLAQIGQEVQSGDVPQHVLDAFEYVKSHLSSGGKQLQDAVQTLKQHVGEAISPTLHAQAAEAPAASGWTPEKAPDGWTPEVVRPMNTAKVNGQDVPVEDWRQAVGKGQVIFSNKVLAGATENAPAIGGAIGGVMGGVPGAVAGGAAGSLVKAAIQRPDEAMAHPLQTAGYAAAAGVGQGALEGAGQMVPKALTAGAKAVYRSYLKPSLSMKLAPKAEQIVNTALNEALPITKSGATKAQQIITALNQQVQDVLDNSSGTVDLHDVADRLRMWATKTYYKPGVSTGDYESALAVADSIDKHASLGVKALFTPSVDVSVSEANASKQALQKAARNAYGTQSSATTTAQKVGASEMRQAIEKQAPEVAGLNAREAKLIDAAKAIARAVGREGNQYKMHGTKAMVGALVGSEETARTGDPWGSAAKGLAVTLALQPGVATRAAIVASRLGKMSGIAPASAARLAIAAIKSEPDTAPAEQSSNVVQVGPYRVEPQ
jgi:hypothetical protein